MPKHNVTTFVLLLGLALLALTSCTTAVVEEAVQQAEQEATTAAIEVEQAAASETETPPEAELEPTIEASGDDNTAVYGNIDELNLNGVTIQFWHQHRDARDEELNALIDEFNATNPYGITVEASFEGSYGDIYDKMIAGLTTGDVPNIVVAYQNQAAAYQVADGLISLDPYIENETYGLSEADRADFFDAFVEQDQLPQFDGASFGFPPHRSMEVLFYNQTWLEELGYDGPPTTPAEFYEMACAATDPNAGTVGYEISTDASRFASFVFARGGDIYDYTNNTFTLNSPEAVEAMTLMQQMYTEGCATLIAERYSDQADFGNEITLFTIGTSSGLPAYQELVNQRESGPFVWSVAPIPYTTSEPVQNIYGASVSLPRTTPEEQLASWLFLKYYTSPKVQARWAKASNYFPARESVANELDDYFEENPAYAKAFSLLQYSKSEPPVAGYDIVRDDIAEAYSRILMAKMCRLFWMS
jgi:multiple sugar transport system substrate-binding protein